MQYRDLNGHDCRLSLTERSPDDRTGHVIVLARYRGDWLLTEHPLRGLEFPGGKREAGESVEAAAVREVYEETGAVMGRLEWLGEYAVFGGDPFVKAAFYGEADRLEEVPASETNGRVFLETLALDDRFSFLMKDDGMKALIKAAEAKLKKPGAGPGF
ncbi:NUDIX domain-containing protein [Indiicoccus explosivorum]|uniref:NUDIX domain-containing protein n=1 Tax=Indiicoccus explosivorum TaxID=1917864 RepID=UPI000B451320|nr:NUDIX domain-containing protein [Indiicoccus explosivorum]